MLTTLPKLTARSIDKIQTCGPKSTKQSNTFLVTEPNGTIAYKIRSLPTMDGENFSGTKNAQNRLFLKVKKKHYSLDAEVNRRTPY